MKHFYLYATAIVVAIMGLYGCSTPTITEADATKWIAAYSPETIAPGSKIRIEITDSLRKKIFTSVPLKKAIRFSPSIHGEWRDTGRFLEFIPTEGSMKQGREYECIVNIGKLAQCDSIGAFAFSFFVEEHTANLQIDRIRIDPNDADFVVVEGLLLLSHEADITTIEKALSIKFIPEAKVEVRQQTQNYCEYNFTISNIKRQTHTRSAQLIFKANEIGFGKEISANFAIEGRNFRVMWTEMHNSSYNPFVEIQFSSPLSSEQDLEGLITLEQTEITNIYTTGNSRTNVRVYFKHNGLANLDLHISELIKCADGSKLSSEYHEHYEPEEIPSAVEVPLSGTILPDGNNLTLPFRAVNLAAVDVRVVKIYADNVLMFLQDNELNGNYDLRRSGQLIYKKTVRLDDDESLDLHQWQNFSINLKGLFRQERGAIYNISVTFRDEYSLMNHIGSSRDLQIPIQDGVHPSEVSNYYYYGNNNYNLLASNLGLIVKGNDSNHLWCAVSDIMTTSPLAGIKVTAYDYQLREVGKGYTSEQGFVDFDVRNEPFVVVATNGISTSYLKVTDGRAKSLSTFNVSGKQNNEGIKGFIYGERGVWRPGDTVYLSMMVEDKQRMLPTHHPVTMELYTPQGNMYKSLTNNKGVNGLYVFEIPITEDAPTGKWNAIFNVGGKIFSKDVRIETIKPNRLKININTPDIIHSGKMENIAIQANWLAGSPAAGLDADLSMVIYSNPTPFDEFKQYAFANPLVSFNATQIDLFKAKLDSVGYISKPTPIKSLANEAAGVMQANIICKVKEFGGDMSITSRSVRLSPFNSYVGINLGTNEYETDCDLSFPIITTDAEGNPISNRKLEYKIYRLNWSWWWECSARDLSRYVQGTSAEVVATGEITTTNTGASIPFRIDYPSWGRYLIFVSDRESGHSTGGVVNIDWPSWRGRSNKNNSTASSIMSFALDKKSYKVGEYATIYLPQSAGGKVLLSIENGSRVISRRWVNTSAEQESAHKIRVNKDMAPNFYIHATLLQPHAQTVNDLPIRMYGVEGAEVIDASSKLHPEVDSPDEIRPQQEFTIKISERDGKPMSYTLAIVDEGLLDVTSFVTPDPWRAMNQREALGIKTWDVYDDVVGAYAGKFTSVLSIGGDLALRRAAGKEKRFNPVVKFIGPFTLTKGVKSHKITLPMYIGSVRVMVVAGHNGSYGHTEKNIKVSAPLMIQATLPRMLACGDKISMPINIFAEEALGCVDVNIKAEGTINIIGTPTKQLYIDNKTEHMINFDLECDKHQSGKAKIIVSASSERYKASDTIYIDVRNPLPPIITSDKQVVNAGNKTSIKWQPFSRGEAKLGISTMPSIDFSGAFAFVENYSHYCTEQLSSRAMYMLYAQQSLPDAERVKAQQMLPEILRNICSRQLNRGGFAYWPGDTSPNAWATSMAGEVLVEARRQGYSINPQAIERWKDYQKSQLRSNASETSLQQAYRLYTLALSGEIEIAAMNRLRESDNLSYQTAMRLAAAYAIAGRNDIARKVIERYDTSESVNSGYVTFASPLRDKAMILETRILVDDVDYALKLAYEIANEFSVKRCSTQEVAFVSAAMFRLSERIGAKINNIKIKQDGEIPKTLNGLQGVNIYDIQPENGEVQVENNSDNDVYLTLTTKHNPSADESVSASSSGIALNIEYTDLKGNPMDISNLKQGTEFYANITIAKGVDSFDSESMALTYQIPSGWEIWNERLVHWEDNDQCRHIDIRDDRINYYFTLNKAKSKKIQVRLRAAYVGEYLLPQAIVEDMYDMDCRANNASVRIRVINNE